MFCPRCHDEYRPGFTRCGTCDVDLVEHESAEPRVGRAAPAMPPAALPVRFVDFCGFFALDEARAARDQLRTLRIPSEIAVRESPEADASAGLREEYWLRVDAQRLPEVAQALREITQSLVVEGQAGENGSHDEDEESGFECGACGHTVSDEASACPNCGARFEG